MTVEYQEGLRVVAQDDCTLVDLGCLQGLWTEEQYLKLTDECNRLLEFTQTRRSRFLFSPGTPTPSTACSTAVSKPLPAALPDSPWTSPRCSTLE